MTNDPQGAGGAWQQAIATRRTQLAGGATLPSAAAARRLPDITRRRFILLNFWAGLGTALAGSVGILLDFLYPRGVVGFGGPVPAGKVTELVKGGNPKEYPIGQFWLINLDPAEARPGGAGGGDGIIALWRKCPHLGCSVPWRPGFNFEGDSGWFRCPCHGSTYTKAGVRVFGPAPRSMDTMEVEIDGAGNITVQTGKRTPGGPDNPTRAIKV
jgi:cytochrome b6-f complex iron-sulfur subunit